MAELMHCALLGNLWHARWTGVSGSRETPEPVLTYLWCLFIPDLPRKPYFQPRWYIRVHIKACSGKVFTEIQKISLQPGLTSQRHSALINSDSEYFQVCFRAVHFLKISEQRWFLNNSEWQFLVHFSLFLNFLKYLNLQSHNSGSPRKLREVNKTLLPQTWTFGLIVTAQVTKQIWFNFSKTFLCL